MNWRWLILDHVPPELHLSKQERQHLTALVKGEQLPLSLRAEFLGFAIGLPLVVCWYAIFPWFSAVIQGTFGRLSLLLNVVLFWMVLWFVFATINHLFRRRHTYRGLREMGFEICESCGYWLRGLGDDVKQCPECGAARVAMPARLDMK